MKQLWKRYDVRLLLLFLLLAGAYLLIAAFFHAPRGYYGTIEQPRFADPWFERTRVILSGGLLYRDVFTATPPLTNFLLVPPSVVADWLGTVNPWATGSFMIYFALFNLFTALLLLYLSPDKAEGYRAAVLFLLNPLTFSNAILRRQDESVLVFFFALTLLLVVRRSHLKAAVALGLALLVKLTAALMIPIILLHTWNWRYVVVPVVVFMLVFAPFLILAGDSAIFWDFSQQDTQHPFQLGGVSLGSLWNRYHDEASSVAVNTLSALFLVASAAGLAFVSWYRAGIWRDLSLLLLVVLLFTPKLHTGYFSMIVLTLAPLLHRRYQVALYFLFGAVAVAADFYKWPIENFPVAFWLMVLTFALLVPLTLDVYFSRQQEALSPASLDPAEQLPPVVARWFPHSLFRR